MALGQVFLPVLQFSAASIIRESLLSSLDLHVVLRRKINGRNTGTFQNQFSFGKRAAFDRNLRPALSRAVGKSIWSYSCTSTPSYSFIAWCVIKQMNTLMFTIAFVAKVSKPVKKSERHCVEIALHCTKYILPICTYISS